METPRPVIRMLLERPMALRRRSRVASDAVGVVGQNVVTMCLNFATALALARILGAREFGTYAFAFACAMLLAVPAVLGLPPLVTRTIATAHVHEDWGRMRGILTRGTQATVVSSTAIIAVAGPVGWVVLTDQLSGPYLVSLALIPIVALTSVRQAAMAGLGRVVLGRTPETLVWPGLFLTSVGVMHVATGGELDATVVMTLHVATALVALTVGTLLLRGSLPDHARRVVPVHDTRVWLRSALPLVLIGGIGVLNAQIGVILLALLTGPAAAGAYSVAARAATVSVFLFTTGRFAVAPAVARLQALEQTARLQRTVTRAAKTVFLVTLPITVAMIVFADTVVGVFGANYGQAADALRLLCVGQVATVAVGYAGAVLLMTGHAVAMTKAVAAGSIVTILLSPLLITLWGIEGAAVATAAGAIVTSVRLALATWQRVRVYSPAIVFPRAFREAG